MEIDPDQTFGGRPRWGDAVQSVMAYQPPSWCTVDLMRYRTLDHPEHLETRGPGRQDIVGGREL